MQVLYCDTGLATSTINRRYSVVLGIQPKIYVPLWFHLKGIFPIGPQSKFLLRALSFLKVYRIKDGRASQLQNGKKIVENRLEFLLWLLTN